MNTINDNTATVTVAEICRPGGIRPRTVAFLDTNKVVELDSKGDWSGVFSRVDVLESEGAAIKNHRTLPINAAGVVNLKADA